MIANHRRILFHNFCQQVRTAIKGVIRNNRISHKIMAFLIQQHITKFHKIRFGKLLRTSFIIKQIYTMS